MIRIEASAICSHGMCEGMPADPCSDTDSVGTVVVFAQNTGVGPIADLGSEVWLSWAIEHGFGLEDEPGEVGRFPADDSTRSIAVQRREALVSELEES